MSEKTKGQRYSFQGASQIEAEVSPSTYPQAAKTEESKTPSDSEISLGTLLTDLPEVVSFRLSSSAHIKVKDDGCQGCTSRGCLYACPANLFQLTADGSVLFNYESCFECGACAIVCPTYVDWSYPIGGYGVAFSYG
ncbi:MAG: 4Fe-4S binding protein [Actinomycetota bacterium]|nr:4Fe-4S binding protein [Actinomycetota bacterium]